MACSCFQNIYIYIYSDPRTSAHPWPSMMFVDPGSTFKMYEVHSVFDFAQVQYIEDNLQMRTSDQARQRRKHERTVH